MASKAIISRQIMRLRSSLRSRGTQNREAHCTGDIAIANQPDSHQQPNPFDDHKQSQIKQKNEKDSTPQPNHEVQTPTIQINHSRRTTHHALNNNKQVPAEPDAQQQQVTPQDNPITRLSEEQNSRKLIRIGSACELGESGPSEMGLTAKKSGRTLQTSSPYSQIRKSYRKIHRRQIVSIPYRRCHDVFQGRIVAIINKLEGGKNCNKDFEGLLEKIQRISIKDMMNRFIVGGIGTVVRLAREKGQYEVRVTERLETELRRLIVRIGEELERTDDFEEPSRGEEVRSAEYRGLVIRKIFRMLRRRYPSDYAGSLRERTLAMSQQLFGGEASMGKVVRFLRNMENI